MNKTEALRQFKMGFITPLVADGIPSDVAWRAVDMAHNAVEKTEKLMVETAVAMGDVGESKLMMAVASKMLTSLSNAMTDTLLETTKEDFDVRAKIMELLAKPGMSDFLDQLGLSQDTIKDIIEPGADPVTAMLAKAGVFPTEADAVIVSRTQDAADCDCDNCTFANKVKATPGTRVVPLEMGFVAYILPVEVAKDLMGDASGLTATAVGMASIH